MKISFILPPPNLSGGIKVTAIYAKALVVRGHDVTLISPMHQKRAYKDCFKSLLKGNGWLARQPFYKSHLDGLNLDYRVLDCFRPIINSDVPDSDVVIATWWETAEWVNKLSEEKGVKVYFVQGHEVFPHLPVERVRATYKLPLQKIVIAGWLQEIMAKEYDDYSSMLVSNAVDHKQFFAVPRGKQNTPTIGFLYGTIFSKGMDITLQAIEKVREYFPKLRVICFGIYTPDDRFDQQIEFHYSPPQEQIRELYAQCDAWVTTSRTEGFNLPAMEAMACRTPVVSTKAGWPEEGVVSGENGVLVDVDDIEAVAEGVRWILNLPEEQWKVVSSHAEKTVADYSWENSASKFEEALELACLEQRKK